MQITFLQDYYSCGRVQVQEGTTLRIEDGSILQLGDVFLDMNDLYDLERRKIVELK